MSQEHELDDLIQEVLDGTASEATRAALSERLEQDRDARMRFQKMSALFAQLDSLGSLAVPVRASERVTPERPVATTPRDRSARPSRAPRDAARRRLLLFSAAATLAVAAIGLSRSTWQDPGDQAAGSIGIESIPITSRWIATDANVSMGAVRVGRTLRLRALLESTAASTIEVSIAPTRWHVIAVRSMSGNDVWKTRAAGALEVAVRDRVELQLTLEPVREESWDSDLELRIRVGDHHSVQQVSFTDATATDRIEP